MVIICLVCKIRKFDRVLELLKVLCSCRVENESVLVKVEVKEIEEYYVGRILYVMLQNLLLRVIRVVGSY